MGGKRVFASLEMQNLNVSKLRSQSLAKGKKKKVERHESKRVGK